MMCCSCAPHIEGARRLAQRVKAANLGASGVGREVDSVDYLNGAEGDPAIGDRKSLRSRIFSAKAAGSFRTRPVVVQASVHRAIGGRGRAVSGDHLSPRAGFGPLAIGSDGDADPSFA